jgi:transposase
VYLDESGFAHDMPRTHGYSLKGKRCYGEKDWHARGRVNVIGAIVGFVFLTVCLFDSNINSDVFYAWLTKDLLPKTPSESVIVLDNATFHKRNDMVQAIKMQGHIPEYLPPYSPDLNPIEHKWAQVKALRKQHRCSVYEVFSFYNFLC